MKKTRLLTTNGMPSVKYLWASITHPTMDGFLYLFYKPPAISRRLFAFDFRKINLRRQYQTFVISRFIWQRYFLLWRKLTLFYHLDN